MKSSSSLFNSKTFAYFDAAKRHRRDPSWVEKNKASFDHHVKKPLENLTIQLSSAFSQDLRGIDFLPRKISRPLRRNPDHDGALVRTHATAFFAEKPTSQFEWNPGLYLSIGSDAGDNFLGVGLYMVSSRQLSLLRNAIVENYEEIDAILTHDRIKKNWGELGGEVYKRFPKGFDPSSEAAKYLNYKQFFLGKELKRKQICNKRFADQVLEDFDSAIPFLRWLRSKVGVYRRDY